MAIVIRTSPTTGPDVGLVRDGTVVADDSAGWLDEPGPSGASFVGPGSGATEQAAAKRLARIIGRTSGQVARAGGRRRVEVSVGIMASAVP
jgi:hypothetical protein